MIDYKEHAFPYESFIGGWYMPEKLCDNLVAYYNNNKNLTHKGSFLNLKGENISSNDIKESYDLCFVHDTQEMLLQEYINNLKNIFHLYDAKYEYPSSYFKKFGLIEPINIQYYPKKGGYKTWHFERVVANTNRFLVFMTYLNDVPDGGTNFKYQNITSPAKKGLTLFWPSDFTHIHKGQISETSEKYIITGWLNILK